MTALQILLDFFIYALAGMAASYFYFVYKRRDLLGGFWGGAVIGTVGAVIISWLTGIEGWFMTVLTFLMKPTIELWNHSFFRVNLIAAVIGSFIFVYIMNRINHDKERRF